AECAVARSRPLLPGLRGVGRRRRGSVLEVGMLGRDECNAPFTVEVHRQLSLLERLRGRELVAETRLELDELAVAVPVDELLLPLPELRPGLVGPERRVVLRVEPRAAERRDVA